jgi:two-component system, NarL family, sensor histidine kinase DegS
MKKSLKTLRAPYRISSAILLLLVIGSFFLISALIVQQEDDARVINLAGRQRMLSQRITHLSIQMGNESNDQNLLDFYNNELEVALLTFKESHEALKFGDESLEIDGDNSEFIIGYFDSISEFFDQIVNSAQNIVNEGIEIKGEHQDVNVQTIIKAETPFLKEMDIIVFQYDKESSAQILLIEQALLATGALFILVIIIEILFIFRPSTRKTYGLINDLSRSNRSLIEKLDKIKETKIQLSNVNSSLEGKNTKLEKLNKILVGRELKMVELKKDVRKLEKEKKS